MGENNKVKTNFGEIFISKEVIALLAGMAAVECYGIVGMASGRLRDGIAELLKKENLSRGIKVITEGENLIIELSVIVGYGTKMSEVGQNVVEKVRYVVENLTGLKVHHVLINIQGVRGV
ncbi:Asp23/Gls24 family envelope stress response protein [Candidatus Contubernalis alkaliaceticus]|uniref:Asp23/Gls24 family envelope stress response protein n=1 Tax=Candidatus Contubernalis alkaliaceticus TaxID=338645 RepID=UPI001F4C3C22|nr:Asp23/Gls24 family envelope stress response protein [Candidatus Contubernalis alkalaceticus]UNC92769.1 Asp23/Gls24 family envelope stress response protein [Candidatus Contubernalis alkalaceticus]